MTIQVLKRGSVVNIWGISKTQPGSKWVHGKWQCLLSSKSSQSLAFCSGLLVLKTLIKLPSKIRCSPGFFFLLSASFWSCSHDTSWLQVGCSFIGNETSFAYILGVLGWQFVQSEENSLVNRGFKNPKTGFSAASNAALNRLCFQEMGKIQNIFIYLAKQMFPLRLSFLKWDQMLEKVGFAADPHHLKGLLCFSGDFYWFSQTHLSF